MVKILWDRGKAVCVTVLILFSTFSVLSACDLYNYGQLGGADKTDKLLPGDPGFERIMASLSGVWYSHYAGVGRLDGYRIGRWDNFDELVEDSGKDALFPALVKETYTNQSGSAIPSPGDYFVLYDDSVLGQSDNGAGGSLGNTRYIGVVRAINVFNGDPGRGAVIIEYLKGCAPRWLETTQGLSAGEKPFFGLYYRVLKPGVVQMANAVNLAALYSGERYYTETARLDEAAAKNGAENEAEFISWGAVIPQEREP